MLLTFLYGSVRYEEVEEPAVRVTLSSSGPVPGGRGPDCLGPGFSSFSGEPLG